MPEHAHPPQEPSFEEAMGELETIVSSLENGRLPLEEMVTAYERGVKLLRTCRTRLDTARQRVELITASLDDKGKASLAEFAPGEAQEEAEAAPARKAKRKSPPPPDEPAAGDIRLI